MSGIGETLPKLAECNDLINDIVYTAASGNVQYHQVQSILNNCKSTMSKQAQHPILLTPGPIEVDDDVLLAMGHHAESHVDPTFGRIFGETLTMLRSILQTSDEAGSQPFIISGSGTLGFDQVAVNVFEPGESALVLNAGYWGDSFAECLRTYGVEVHEITASLGAQVPMSKVEEALQARRYKAITITHIDTVSGVLSDVRSISKLVKKVSPETLVIVDGVCSIACEDIRFDEWQLDVVLGASQKALGAPAGLSIVMASSRVMAQFGRRQTPARAYYASWKKWLPIMQAYEAKQQPLYFATPPTQLIRALHVSLSQILTRPLQERFEQHQEASRIVKLGIERLGLKQVVEKPEDQSHGMTAFYLPTGLRAEHVLPVLARQKGVVMARGPQKQIAGQYVRFSHMGVTATDRSRGDIERGLAALEEVLKEVTSDDPAGHA